MSTTLRICIERQLENGQWARVEPLVPNPFYPDYPDEEPQMIREVMEYTNFWTIFDFFEWDEDGSEYDDKVPSLAPERGLPHDCSPVTLWEKKDLSQHFHTYGFSWALVTELLHYPWNATVFKTIYRVKHYKNPLYGPPCSSRKTRIPVPVHRLISWIPRKLIPRLLRYGPPDKVRIIYWFYS